MRPLSFHGSPCGSFDTRESLDRSPRWHAAPAAHPGGRLSDRYALRVCYEAGPTGYGRQRQLAQLGVDCVVIAPSLTPRRAGRRVKTDHRDARALLGLIRAGELTAVRVPDPEEEAPRDLLRAREDLREDIVRTRD